VASLEDEEAKKRVQEALWAWAVRVIVLAVTFGFGTFAGYLLWGSGNDGAIELRRQVPVLEAQVLDHKNKRVDLESKVQVISQRYEECQKALAKAGSAGGGAATP
jgi:hypothetical protein